MSNPFDDIVPRYANILSEAKDRLSIVEKAISSGPPKDPLDYVAMSDLCAVQFRKIFEAIALGCLAVHGDFLPGTNRLRKDVYRADAVLKHLARLHADFFPTPCEVQRENGRVQRLRLLEGDDWLTREELQRLYFKLDEELHVGTLTRRVGSAKAITISSYRRMLAETKRLILVHWIRIANGCRLIVDITGPRALIEVGTPRE